MTQEVNYWLDERLAKVDMQNPGMRQMSGLRLIPCCPMVEVWIYECKWYCNQNVVHTWYMRLTLMVMTIGLDIADHSDPVVKRRRPSTG